MAIPFKTTKDLFEEVAGNITLPAHTDYAIAGKEMDIYDVDFCISGKVDYGSSEGIYLDLTIEGCFGADNEYRKENLGTVKTLSDSDEAYRDFCNLIADFVFAARAYRQEHKDELIRKGYRVSRKGGGAALYTYEASKAYKFAGEGYDVFDCLTQQKL